MTPLKRAARALYEKQAEQQNWDRSWELLCPVGRKKRIEQVRAVLQAIREPSDGMIDVVVGDPIQFKDDTPWRCPANA